MYKKILCALCIVISLIFIVPIIYVLVTRGSSNDELIEVKGPRISIFFSKSDKRFNESVRLHDTPNSEFVINPSIWNASDGEVVANYKKSLRFECHSNVPVKWKYYGKGDLVSEVRVHNKREITSFEDKNSYWFESTLEFFNLSEQISGKYLCRTTNVPGAQVFVYVYGKGSQVFISRNEMQLEIEPNEEMIISCPVSDPTRAISLREVIQPLDKIILKEIDSSIIVSFDPKIGFQLKPNSWGSYSCFDDSSGQNSGIVKLYKPKRFVVDGDFLTTSSTNVPQNSTSLRILCEAKEEITLNFVNFNEFRRRQVYFTNTSSHFEFTSRIKLRTEYFTNYSTVECVTVKDKRVLRVWKFLRNEWTDKTHFRFDNSSKGYECCTDTLEIPRLKQIVCYTETECELKKSCIKLGKGCNNYESMLQPTYEGKAGCALAKVEKNPSGILECSYRNSTKNYVYIYNKKTQFQNFTSSDFKKKKVPKEAMIKVLQRPLETKLTQDDEATFDCYGGKFFITSGFQWAVKKWNGPIEYLINQSQPDEESPDELHEWIKIKVKEITAKTVTCFAPGLHSYEWVNASTKFRYI